MRASEWQFLCAVHEQPKSCCAIDYCCHTLDWAANIVSDQKLFPSRFAVLNDAHNKNAGVKNLVNVFRRLHRIFAHAWFQHRSVFWSVESQTGLYVFFKTVCDLYDLLPAENYKLPPEAEGLEGLPAEPEAEKPPPAILKPSSQQRPAGAEDDSLHPGGRINTRRHIRSSPSTGSAVTTVIEADEEETENVSNKMQSLHISGTGPIDQEPESAEVPVIVEHSVMDGAPRPDQPPSEAVEPASTEEEEVDQTIVEPETTAKPEEPQDGGEEEEEEDEEEQEPNVVPIRPDEIPETKPAETTAEELAPVEKPKDKESKPSTSETTPSPEPYETKDELPKQGATSDDMAGESGQVTDPE